MLSCAQCGATSADGRSACARCGRVLEAGTAGRGGLQDLKDETVLRDLDSKDRLKRRWKAHAITGAITFFLLNALLGFSSLVGNAIASVLFGAPLGYVISRLGGGLYRGALIAAIAFMALRLTLSVPALLRGSDVSEVVPMVFLWGLLGSIPGMFIGLHVDVDD